MATERPKSPDPTAPPMAGPPLWQLGALVAVGVLFAYWPSVHGGALWDDGAHLTRPDLRGASGLFRIWTNLRETQQYYPVLHSAFWFEHRLWGDASLGYHLLNMTLHGLSACVLAALLARLWRMGEGREPRGAAALAGLLFAVHPVCVESVAWMSEQKNTLSLLLYLLSGWLYLDFSETRRRRAYVGASLLFAAALGTKTVTASLPAAILLVLWWRRGRLQARRDVAPLLPWFLIAASSGLLTAWVERHVVGADGAGFDLAPAERLLLAGRVVWFYLGKLVWPTDLTFIYPRWDPVAGWAGAALLAASLALTGALFAVRGRARGPLAAWLFFAGSLFPVLGFFNVFPFLYSFVADHFQYLASVGAFAAAGWAATRLVEALPARARPVGWALCLALAALLALLARNRSGAFRDSETLYRDTLDKNPACWMAYNNLAVELAAAGKTAEALDHYRSALKIRPNYPEAHNNLGNLLAGQPGAEGEALLHYREALRLRPGFAEAHTDLANLLARTPGGDEEALEHYMEALRLRPDDPGTRFGLAALLARLPGREREAEEQYRASLALEPDSPEAHSNLGILLARSPGREREALAEFAEAARINPRYVGAYLNAAILEVNLGKPGEARESCRRALAVDPQNALALRILEGLGSP